MTKAPVFPLVMKIVLGSLEFNPILAKNENCHRFSGDGMPLRRSQAQVSISATSRRGVQRHAAARIALTRSGARSNAKADESENNGCGD
jgi:hypothetical protein